MALIRFRLIHHSDIPTFHYSITHISLAQHAVDTRFGYPLFFANHGDTEGTEAVFFFCPIGLRLGEPTPRRGEGDRAKDLSPAGTI